MFFFEITTNMEVSFGSRYVRRAYFYSKEFCDDVVDGGFSSCM
jgi:hypothetical protein